MMRVPIHPPDTGEASCRFSAWFIEEGDEVVEGERLAEVLIPGVAIDVIAPADGVLCQRLARSKAVLTIADVIGWIETEPATSTQAVARGDQPRVAN